MSLNILAKGIHTLMMLTKTLLPKKFKPPYTLSIGYGKWIQNKNTWLSRSRRWMSLNFYFHRYLFFIMVGLIVGKKEDFVIVCMYFKDVSSSGLLKTSLQLSLNSFFNIFAFLSLSCFLHWTSVLCFFISRRRPWNTLQDKILLLIWRASIDVIKLLNNYLWFNHSLLSQKSW